MRQVWLLVSAGALTLLIIGAATVLFGMMRRKHALAVRIQLSRGVVTAPGPTGQQVAHRARVIDMTNASALRELITSERPDIVVPEIEAIATTTLLELEN